MHWNQARARFIRFPCLTMPGVWPFDSMGGGVDAKALAMQAAGHGRAFHFQDRLLSRMRLYIADPDERFEAYRTLTAPRHGQLAAYLGRFKPRGFFAHRAAKLQREDGVHEPTIGSAIVSQMPVARSSTHRAARLRTET